MCEMIDEQVATLLIIVILVIMVGSSGYTTRALEELGVRESRSAERKINSGYRWLCDHYDDDHKVDGDDVPDANGDDQVNLTAVRVITAVLTQGRFAGGQGQEYAQVFSVVSFYR